MTNIITETCEHEVEHSYDIDLCDDLVCIQIDHLASLEEIIPNYDFPVAMYCMLMNSITILMDFGWSEEQLIKEIKHQINDIHVNNERLTEESVNKQLH